MQVFRQEYKYKPFCWVRSVSGNLKTVEVWSPDCKCIYLLKIAVIKQYPLKKDILMRSTWGKKKKSASRDDIELIKSYLFHPSIPHFLVAGATTILRKQCAYKGTRHRQARWRRVPRAEMIPCWERDPKLPDLSTGIGVVTWFTTHKNKEYTSEDFFLSIKSSRRLCTS